MKRDGNLCKWYLPFEGCCFLNGSACYNPLSVEGCDIQCRDIFHNKSVEHKGYEPNATDNIFTRFEIKKALMIRKGDCIAEQIIPYSELEYAQVDPSFAIKPAKEEIKRKFSEAGIYLDIIRVFYNVKLYENTYGIYVIGVGYHK